MKEQFPVCCVLAMICHMGDSDHSGPKMHFFGRKNISPKRILLSSDEPPSIPSSWARWMCMWGRTWCVHLHCAVYNWKSEATIFYLAPGRSNQLEVAEALPHSNGLAEVSPILCYLTIHCHVCQEYSFILTPFNLWGEHDPRLLWRLLLSCILPSCCT